MGRYGLFLKNPHEHNTPDFPELAGKFYANPVKIKIRSYSSNIIFK
jgi:hypothetical protein